MFCNLGCDDVLMYSSMSCKADSRTYKLLVVKHILVHTELYILSLNLVNTNPSQSMHEQQNQTRRWELGPLGVYFVNIFLLHRNNRT